LVGLDVFNSISLSWRRNSVRLRLKRKITENYGCRLKMLRIRLWVSFSDWNAFCADVYAFNLIFINEGTFHWSIGYFMAIKGIIIEIPKTVVIDIIVCPWVSLLELHWEAYLPQWSQSSSSVQPNIMTYNTRPLFHWEVDRCLCDSHISVDAVPSLR
jgi:hypothetical protein